MEVLLCPFWSIAHPNTGHTHTHTTEECHPVNLEATASMGTFQIQPHHSNHGASPGDPRRIIKAFHWLTITQEFSTHKELFSIHTHLYYRCRHPQSSPHSLLNCVLTFQSNGSPSDSWDIASFSFLRNLCYYEREVDHILFANLQWWVTCYVIAFLGNLFSWVNLPCCWRCQSSSFAVITNVLPKLNH